MSRACQHCEAELVRKKKETAYKFSRRKFCSRSCSVRHQHELAQGRSLGFVHSTAVYEPAMSFRQIAAELGVSHALVEQILDKALDKLRRSRAARTLREHLEVA